MQKRIRELWRKTGILSLNETVERFPKESPSDVKKASSRVKKAGLNTQPLESKEALEMYLKDLQEAMPVIATEDLCFWRVLKIMDPPRCVH